MHNGIAFRARRSPVSHMRKYEIADGNNGTLCMGIVQREAAEGTYVSYDAFRYSGDADESITNQDHIRVRVRPSGCSMRMFRTGAPSLTSRSTSALSPPNWLSIPEGLPETFGARRMGAAAVRRVERTVRGKPDVAVSRWRCRLQQPGSAAISGRKHPPVIQALERDG